MNKFKFSIITVCYNAEIYIERTIKSVICQNCIDVQYIIIDGGSTDNTLSIVEKYSKNINIIFSEPDSGIYDAMNKGLKLVEGEFVNFLNAGDTFFSNNTLQYIQNCIKKETKLISGDFNLINFDTGLNKLIKTKKINIKNLKRDFKACHQSIFISTDICSHYDTSFKIRADYLWVIDSALKVSSSEIVKVDKSLIYYLQEGSSFHSFWNSLYELVLIQKKKFSFQIIFNLDIYIYKIIRHLKYEIISKKNRQ